MPDKKINLTIVTMDGCIHCARAKEVLAKVQPDYPDLTIKEVKITSDEGQKLISKYSIMSNPGIIINDELFSVGGTTEEDLRKKFGEILSS